MTDNSGVWEHRIIVPYGWSRVYRKTRPTKVVKEKTMSSTKERQLTALGLEKKTTETGQTYWLHPRASLGDYVSIGHNTRIHDCAIVASHAHIGRNCIIEGYVNIYTAIGLNTKIMGRSTVGNCCTIMSNCYISPGASIGNNTRLGTNVHIGEEVCIPDSLELDRNTKWLRPPLVIKMPYTFLYMASPEILVSGCVSENINDLDYKKIKQICHKHYEDASIADYYTKTAYWYVQGVKRGHIYAGEWNRKGTTK